MTKRVQILGHTAEVANQFVGLERELTADTDNRELRLHDGVTEGGAKVLDRDANDNRYQARSTELDGLLGFEPNNRGFLARLGPSDYRLRSMTVNGAQLVITNANGYAGNPLVELAPEISSNHTFTGLVTFVAAIQAAGGVVGNLVGNTTGTHTGSVVGNVTGNLTGNALGAHTGSFVGDLNTVGHNVTMGAGQIQLSWLSAAIASFIVNAGVPVGTIVAFAGALGDIPANWFICDGTNGTPDLRDRFVVGVGPVNAPNSTGGSTTHTHGVAIDSGGAHLHTGTVAAHVLTIAEMPLHDHGNGVTNPTATVFPYGLKACPATPDTIDNNSANGNFQGITESIGGGGGHAHGLTIDSGGAHVHTGSTGSTSTLPPFYALYYIMKGA